MAINYTVYEIRSLLNILTSAVGVYSCFPSLRQSLARKETGGMHMYMTRPLRSAFEVRSNASLLYTWKDNRTSL